MRARKSIRLIAIATAIALAPIASSAQSATPAPKKLPFRADVIITNARIFTGDPAHPWASAIAIADDRVIAVGSESSVEGRTGPRTRHFDAGGHLVIPGLNDAHIHLGGYYGAVHLDTRPAITNDPSFTETRETLRALASRTPSEKWIVGEIGATVLGDSGARRGALDAVSGRHPVMLVSYTGHGVILNSAALTSLDVTAQTRDPEGGRIERDAAGHPTGLLEEYAGANAMQKLAESQRDDAMAAAMRDDGRAMLKLGITSVQDMADAYGATRTLKVLRSAALPIRVRIVGMALTAPSARLVASWDSARVTDTIHVTTGGTIRISGIKWVLDGTIVERLAMMRAPYADAPGWRGRLNFAPDTVRTMLLEAREHHQQIMLHVIGDSAAAMVLAEMDSTGGAAAWSGARLRMEHANGLAPDLQRRARAMGVVVVENPAHFNAPHLADVRLAPRGRSEFQPMRSLLDAGIPLAIGSDGPLNPFLNMMLATTHPNNPREAITLTEALTAYTSGGAYAEFGETEKGRLMPGMLADLAVLSQDIFKVPASALPATVSLATMVGGDFVYRNPAFTMDGISSAVNAVQLSSPSRRSGTR